MDMEGKRCSSVSLAHSASWEGLGRCSQSLPASSTGDEEGRWLHTATQQGRGAGIWLHSSRRFAHHLKMSFFASGKLNSVVRAEGPAEVKAASAVKSRV